VRFFRQKNIRPEKSDIDLVNTYRATKDIAVLGELYDRYLEYVYGVCLKIMPDAELSKDAVMQIFEHLVEKLAKHEVKNFKSWLHSVSRNHCLEWLRREKKFKQHQFSEEFMHSLEILHPADEPDVVSESEALHQCIAKLRAEQKRCIELFYLQGHSYDEVAEAIQENREKVRSYIQNGRRNLKICLDKKAHND